MLLCNMACYSTTLNTKTLNNVISSLQQEKNDRGKLARNFERLENALGANSSATANSLALNVDGVAPIQFSRIKKLLAVQGKVTAIESKLNQ